MLAVLAIMLTVVTLFLAALAIWGYATLRADARSVATDVASRVASDIARVVAVRETGSSSRLYQGAVGGLSGAPEEALADALRSVSEGDDAGT